ncbi:MAG: hypothetical protein L0229_19055 [Blastocatellia bacterium]|nr:hypothetical protein [Blastocatellia bacterium]
MSETLIEADETVSLTQRRAFLQLPLEERRRQLSAQAERMIEYYESEAEGAEREEW